MTKAKNSKSDKNSGKPVKGKATNKPKKKAIAKSASPADDATKPSYKIHYIAVEQIEVSKKRRQVHPEKVGDLKGSIAKIGLRTPLTVKPLWGKKPLITGLHRLEAVKALGWKKVPCVYITGGEKMARLWEISENLHRAELTALEESEFIAEWLKLTEQNDEDVSAQNGQKSKIGRPKGGVSDAARKLPGKGTQSAKRHKIGRAAKIAGIDAEVKRQIVDAGLADKPTKLNAIASKPDKNAQLKELQRLKAGRRKADEERSEDTTDDETAFDLMKRQWLEEKKLNRPVWERATFLERTHFIVKVLQHPLDGVDRDEDEHDDEN